MAPTSLVTVFVCVGIEGASVYSRYARKRSDVGVATVMGFLGVLCLLVLVTLLSYGSVVQVFLIVSWFAEHAFVLALKMTGAVMLIPYLLVAAYGLELASKGETYSGNTRERSRDLVRAAIATVYAAGMIYAGGTKYLLLSAIIFAPGTLLFVLARRERKERVFSLAERLLFAVTALAALVALHGLATGSISV